MRVGKLQATVDFGSGSSSIMAFDIIEHDFGTHKAVGYSQVDATSGTITWKMDIDLSSTVDLDSTFNYMGNNTYTWLQAMTVVGDGSSNTPTALINGDNLNNVDGFGIYYKDSASATISNVPTGVTDTFVLEVLPGGGGDQIVQRLTVCDKDNTVVYTRVYYSDAWGEWSFDRVNNNPVLWSGSILLNSAQTATLSDEISKQNNGVVLVFSPYASGAPVNNEFNTCFVPKHFVTSMSERYITVPLTKNCFNGMGTKSVRINNASLTGFATNVASGTNSGITYDNSAWVLRFVIGV